MSAGDLVLSLFPGIGLLDMAFEAEGFCIVRGPDLLWGGDIRRFHPPAGRFDGVIGGPPCQAFSGLGNLMTTPPENLIPEYERVVAAAGPGWWLMENVQGAPVPAVAGYIAKDQLLNNRWFGETQNRVRRFTFGTRDGRPIHVAQVALERVEWHHAVTAANPGTRRPDAKGQLSYTLAESLRLQGCPDDFLAASPFRQRAAQRMVAQGVPLPMGRAVARAVKQAIGAAA
jgi:DNA (cytosine-5)-methyltransferase 1